MRRRLGIAHEDDVVLDPTLIGDAREVAPERAIDQQPMTLQLLGEDALQEIRRLLLIELVELLFSEWYVATENRKSRLRNLKELSAGKIQKKNGPLHESVSDTSVEAAPKA